MEGPADLAPVTGWRAALIAPPGRRTGVVWSTLALVEVGLCTLVVIRDILVPTLVILPLVALSLAARRESWTTLGFRRTPHPWGLAARVLGLTVGWTLVQLAVFIPALNHATGDRQDLSDFSRLQGDVGQLLFLLLLSWTLAAFGEETVYRGFLPTRITDVFGTGVWGATLAIGLSSALFALAHTEQGAIGVAVTFLDALFFSVLRLRYRNLLAPVLAHGFNNTIGLVAFFLIGPVYGFW